jgi:hypothetical protein
MVEGMVGTGEMADIQGMAGDAAEEAPPMSRRWPTPTRTRSLPTFTGSPMRADHRLPIRLLLTTLVALPAAGCARAPSLSGPPARLAGIPLHHAVEDARGLNAVRQFYGGAPEVIEGWTAHYGDSPTLLLYVAATSDAAAALDLVEVTRARVAAGKTPYRNPVRVDRSTVPVYTMTGQEQLHYLFPRGPMVVWISADPAVSEAALAALLEESG